MKFLPQEINGTNVYAGFWKRFVAGSIDSLPFFALMYVDHLLNIFHSIPLMIFSSVFMSFSYPTYNIYFNYKYGGTPGKLIEKIQVTRSDGSKINTKEAFLRSSVDIGFAIPLTIGMTMAMLTVNPDKYFATNYLDQAGLLTAFEPSWLLYLNYASIIWIYSELFVLLLNKRRRALHDFIAGTVVIKREFALKEGIDLNKSINS